ncbi:MAG: ACP S-malonyltransferase [Gammaproteobacteria bacterium]|nr:ACP S-malonyltransferase [Gammaproteobacteria bacterium]NNF49783.1 ACP S-malonyltransferase [Woeseiaceae bacterium]MBT8094162.1 ACP S-malonyltransferase [Gammaproteobacteria bacterium]MBT8104543.1 ACP S-malonyltransferase [Gammaproteobacteria bacterium]NNK24557.1 ACP S-malonyltransferase [Woeseiaceae bacterium]
MSTLFIFPGQGAQYPGMGKDLYEKYDLARKIYDRASDVLGFDIVDLSFNDPGGELNLTRFTQPALLTHQVACLEVFRELNGGKVEPDLTAGHSLGEYSALVAAGYLDFDSALRVVQKRGELMGAHGEGEMSAFPIDLETIRPIAESYHCAVAGYNLPEQTVIGGRSSDLERVEAYVGENFPRRSATRLKTEGAFHTYYMVAAALYFRAMLDDTEFTVTETGVLSNFSGGFHYREPASIRARLFFQLFHPVRWFNNLETAFGEGVARIYEFGGGIGSGGPDEKRPNLQGMIKRAQRATGHKVEYVPAINAALIEAAAAA